MLLPPPPPFPTLLIQEGGRSVDFRAKYSGIPLLAHLGCSERLNRGGEVVGGRGERLARLTGVEFEIAALCLPLPLSMRRGSCYVRRLARSLGRSLSVQLRLSFPPSSPARWLWHSQERLARRRRPLAPLATGDGPPFRARE